jgi:LmbE family N-acetylglucosaminyl deacetylase
VTSSPAQWDTCPPFRPRVVIAAPHPDDEVLGCAGVMSWLDRNDFEVEIVAVTDGDASHARSSRVNPMSLVQLRRSERGIALRGLGLGHLPVDRLGLPDGEVALKEADLSDALACRLDAATTLIVPWRHDGHPDHEAVGRAGVDAAHRVGAACLEVPIWARVRGRRCVPSYVLTLGELHRAKRTAAEAYASQLLPLGPDECDGPVVHPDELDAMTSDTEWLLEPR